MHTCLYNELIAQLKAFADFTGDRIDDWTKKSKEVLKLKEDWKKIGFVSKEKAKSTNKDFWGHFKTFFNNKKKFFKQLDEEREVNFKLKEEFCVKAEALAESEDLDRGIKEVISLQKDWKKIGPAPFKKSNQIFERFKKACDAVFDRKRGIQIEADKAFEANYTFRAELVKTLDV